MTETKARTRARAKVKKKGSATALIAVTPVVGERGRVVTMFLTILTWAATAAAGDVQRLRRVATRAKGPVARDHLVTLVLDVLIVGPRRLRVAVSGGGPGLFALFHARGLMTLR